MKVLVGLQRKASGVFYGWWMLLASVVILSYGGGTYSYGFSVLFKPIIAEFGWTRAATAGAFSLSSLEGGIEAPLVGILIDKLGPRVMNIIGVILMGLGLLALGLFVNSLLAFYLAYLLIALGHNAGFLHPTHTAVGNWFVRKRSIALAIISASFGLGGAIMTPTISWLVGQYGWRPAVVVLGMATFVIGVPLSFFLRRRPEHYGILPDGDVAGEGKPEIATTEPGRNQVSIRLAEGNAGPQEVDFTVWEAVRTKVWWMLGFAFCLRGLAISAVTVHQVPLLIDRGFDPQTAANVFGFMGLMTVPGRLLFGYLGDFLPKRYLLITTYALQALGLVVLLTSTTIEQVYLFTIIYGLGWGAAPLMWSIRGEYFGRKNFASIAGFQLPIVMLGHVIGPVFAGWFFDVTQSYQTAFTLFIVTYILGAALNFLARPPKAPRAVSS